MSTDNQTSSDARTIKTSEFKARRFKLMDDVAENGMDEVG